MHLKLTIEKIQLSCLSWILTLSYTVYKLMMYVLYIYQKHSDLATDNLALGNQSTVYSLAPSAVC